MLYILFILYYTISRFHTIYILYYRLQQILHSIYVTWRSEVEEAELDGGSAPPPKNAKPILILVRGFCGRDVGIPASSSAIAYA